MLFNLCIKNTILRFYLMMLIGIAAVYADSALLVILTFAVGVSAVLGACTGKKQPEPGAGRRVQLESGRRAVRKAG